MLKMPAFRLLVLLFVISISNASRAQDSTDYESYDGSFDIIYGQKTLLKPALYGTVGDWNDVQLGQPISYVGIAFTSIYSINRKYHYYGDLSFSHIIPQKISLGDSINGRFSGFNLSFPFFGWIFFQDQQVLNVNFSGGVVTGRMRLFGDSRIEQINAYFGPFVSLSPRVIFGKIAIRLNARFELDVTRSRWRKVWFSSSPKADLGPMKNTGFSTSVSVGWVLD